MSKVNSSFSVRKVYDLPVNRFVNVALPQYLEQLQFHTDNLNKHKDLDKRQKEQLKGQQVASQLETALQELERVKCQLNPEDEQEFEKKIKPYQNQALTAVKNFKQIFDQSNENFYSYIPENELKQQMMLSQEKILPEEVELEQRKMQLETYESLQKDIEELHDLFSEFSQQVHTQQSTVSEIEGNVEEALENVIEGEQNLAKAGKFKAAMYPLTGAVIGTCIGGPIGLLAGLKIGSFAALTGTVLGFAGGRGLKKWQESIVNNGTVENLTKSQSIPVNLEITSKCRTFPHSASYRTLLVTFFKNLFAASGQPKENMAFDSEHSIRDRERFHLKNM